MNPTIVYISLFALSLNLSFAQRGIFDYKKEKLQGNVKSIEYTYFDMIKHKGKLKELRPRNFDDLAFYNKCKNIKYRGVFLYNTYKIKCLFDENGNQTEIILYDKDGNRNDKNTYRYIYDDKGNMIVCEEFDYKGDLFERSLFTYDGKGNLINKKVYDSQGKLCVNTSRTYDVNNKPVKKQCEKESREIVIYNEKGEKVSHCSEPKSNNMYTYSYDQKGNLLTFKYYNTKREIITNKTKSYIYDSNGNILEITRYDSIKNRKSKTAFTYDERNFCVQKINIHYDSNQHIRCTYVYNFEYDSTGKLFCKKSGMEGHTERIETCYYNETGNLIEKTIAEISGFKGNRFDIYRVDSYSSIDEKGNWSEYKIIYGKQKNKDKGSGILLIRNIEYFQ